MKKQTIEQWEAIMKNAPTENIKTRLSETLEDIALLESIYMTGGKLHHFSEQFSNSAYNERQALCQLSSACYSILREREKQPS